MKWGSGGFRIQGFGFEYNFCLGSEKISLVWAQYCLRDIFLYFPQPPKNGCPMCAHFNINTPCVLPSCLDPFMSLLFLGFDLGAGRSVCDGRVLSFRRYDNKHVQLLHISNFCGMLSLMLCIPLTDQRGSWVPYGATVCGAALQAAPARTFLRHGLQHSVCVLASIFDCFGLPEHPCRNHNKLHFRLVRITRASIPKSFPFFGSLAASRCLAKPTLTASGSTSASAVETPAGGCLQPWPPCVPKRTCDFLGLRGRKLRRQRLLKS